MTSYPDTLRQALWLGMIKLLCQGNDIPTDLQSKTGFWHASHPFLSVLTKKSSSIHLRATLWMVKLKCFRNGTQISECWTWPTDFFLWRTTTFACCQSNRQSPSQQLSSLYTQPEIKKFHFLQEMFTFYRWIANYRSLACTFPKAVSVPSRRVCALICHWTPTGFMCACLLS